MFYAVYDLKEKEECVGIADKRKDIAKLIGTTLSNVNSALSRKTLIFGRYEIKKFEEEV